ncbi:hypothetical protein RCH07_003887 [Arthrobacter sp. CG_A4]|nr:hypothetical protein [Arthrobacter sp. CG_A4]
MKPSARPPFQQAPRGRLARPAVIAALVLLISGMGPLGGMPNLFRPDVAEAAVPSSATDMTKVPHYFGPYPNWANSPQTLADAMVKISIGTPTPVLYGNPLTERKYATDYAKPTGEMGPVLVVLDPIPSCPPAPSTTSRAGTRAPPERARPPRRATSSTRWCCDPPALRGSTPSSTPATS